jgi:hypothetical protein
MAGLVALPAAASVTVDGELDLSYGPAVAVQSVQTGFGNEDGSDNGGDGEGSELDAAYAKVWNNRLYLMLTGNIQPSFNKLEIFIDSVSGGENVLSGTPEYDFSNTSQNLNGLTFDTGFEADYHIFARGGDAGSGRQFDVDIVNRAGGGSASVASNGLSVPLNGGVLGTASGTIMPTDLPGVGNISGATLTQNLEFAFDNGNLAGIIGGSGAADSTAAQAVTTGLELSIALADIGSPAFGSTINISVMQNNGDHNYLSNQFLGGLPAGTGNLGGDGAGGFTGNLAGINLNNFAGLQYFVVPIRAEIPEPGSVVLLGLALVSLTIGSRRRM